MANQFLRWEGPDDRYKKKIKKIWSIRLFVLYLYKPIKQNKMKKIIALFKRGFEDLGYSYYNQLYLYDCKLYLGYVVIRNERFFWIPTYKRVAVCCDKEELDETLKLLQCYN